MPANFRQRFLSGERLLGTLLSIPSGAVAEILADTGFDWLFLDAEHGPLEVTELQTILQAVSRRIACLVRVPSQNEIPIKRALDLGAAGIIVPQVNTAAEAERIVELSRYAPLGARGVGIARAGGYGLNFQPYVASANDTTTVIVQAEHIRAVENIEEIVKIPGVDGVLVGPYDLSASMGLMGQIDHPDVVGAIDRVTKVCQAANMKLGIFGVTCDSIIPYRDRGFTLLVAGVDTIMLGLEAARMLHHMKS
ncbi:MAG: 2,4-dihydroxyhept-2-ene-1,7-dioic acid aldolase [Planctomycetaceae bacterium]|nr:2,4-dihydroxyhept-2-ene-1,7-dioic acid aldolase [Planctomycetaceae bacterium]